MANNKRNQTNKNTNKNKNKKEEKDLMELFENVADVDKEESSAIIENDTKEVTDIITGNEEVSATIDEDDDSPTEGIVSLSEEFGAKFILDDEEDPIVTSGSLSGLEEMPLLNLTTVESEGDDFDLSNLSITKEVKGVEKEVRRYISSNPETEESEVAKHTVDYVILSLTENNKKLKKMVNNDKEFKKMLRKEVKSQVAPIVALIMDDDVETEIEPKRQIAVEEIITPEPISVKTIQADMNTNVFESMDMIYKVAGNLLKDFGEYLKKNKDVSSKKAYKWIANYLYDNVTSEVLDTAFNIESVEGETEDTIKKILKNYIKANVGKDIDKLIDMAKNKPQEFDELLSTISIKVYDETHNDKISKDSTSNEIKSVAIPNKPVKAKSRVPITFHSSQQMVDTYYALAANCPC